MLRSPDRSPPVPLRDRRDRRLSAGVATVLIGAPWTDARQPPGYGATICLVLLSELAEERGFLVCVGEHCDGHRDNDGVGEQAQLSEKQRLTDDRTHDSEIHRIADMAIEPAHDKMAGRGDGGRRADTVHHEADEGLDEHSR
jgi:hypothetical protein